MKKWAIKKPSTNGLGSKYQMVSANLLLMIFLFPFTSIDECTNKTND